MSDTPESDAVMWHDNHVGFEVVDADFARKLERERDEAIIKYTGQANAFETQRNIALSKLEEARKEIKILQIENRDLGIENRDLRWDCEHFVNKIKGGVASEIRLERERDEARAALRELWISADAFLPNFDTQTIARWRKAAGWEGEE